MRTQKKGHRLWILMIVTFVLSWCRVHAQTFDSGSNGSDGALNLTTPSGQPIVIEFDPVALGFSADHNNVYHFTTITIGKDVTVRLTTRKFNAPVFWLAKEAVQIDGAIDLNGEDGRGVSPLGASFPTVPGAGGYSGGVKGQKGSGPSGGNPPTQISPSCVLGAKGGGGPGNAFLVPLLGGSGGGGANTGGGGSGGGALLVASSVSISMTGTITANGGLGFDFPHTGGGGGGGGIRLVAPIIDGQGNSKALGGGAGGATCLRSEGGSSGIIRLESFKNTFTGNSQPQAFLRTPFGVYLPTAVSAPSSIRAVKVNGVNVSSNPTGSFEIPDVTINQSTAVTVEIEAHNIPLGTVAQVYFFSENGADQLIDSTLLTGTLSASTATVSVTLPPGFSRGYVRATWTNP